MSGSGWELVGEVHLGAELTFDEAREAEGLLRGELEALMEELGSPWLDARVTGEGLLFTASPREGEQEDLLELCRGLARLLDPGARGRLVAVGEDFGPVLVFGFTARGVEHPPGD
ncbi:hypothetical protein NNJEOMEG_00614 [Fundidesulfovibrio magnetotacticus]|uniref:Uncharacterized protein n=1 Tax=Fundidesulfovibrio magnetotacticus TaxID=2730080 RepID=A0A6V8LT22_9BACT|nr:hypothetical protein [Fundidesulfovibrio magnetotacticus]GFK92787.1 hypothetical protein NNJEOMEG_00614 [Fundidesulfovibrio magnetotacticus]